MRRSSGSTAYDPLRVFDVGTPEASSSWLMPGVHQLDIAAVNGVMPSSGPVKRPRSIDPMLGV
jgi:hypothetical protein